MQNKSSKGDERNKNQDIQKTKGKMTDVNPSIFTVTIVVKGLN